jgi:neopullulanase
LFIDLKLAENVKPGSFEIKFEKDGKLAASWNYELKKREAGSDERQGLIIQMLFI